MFHSLLLAKSHHWSSTVSTPSCFRCVRVVFLHPSPTQSPYGAWKCCKTQRNVSPPGQPQEALIFRPFSLRPRGVFEPFPDAISFWCLKMQQNTNNFESAKPTTGRGEAMFPSPIVGSRVAINECFRVSTSRDKKCSEPTTTNHGWWV